jgi:hypothetical protein
MARRRVAQKGSFFFSLLTTEPAVEPAVEEAWLPAWLPGEFEFAGWPLTPGAAPGVAPGVADESGAAGGPATWFPITPPGPPGAGAAPRFEN